MAALGRMFFCSLQRDMEKGLGLTEKQWQTVDYLLTLEDILFEYNLAIIARGIDSHPIKISESGDILKGHEAVAYWATLLDR